MSTAEAAAGLGSRSRATGRLELLAALVVPLATALTLIAACLLVLFLPLYIHPALDAAGSAETLGLNPAQATALSDRTVGELWFGPGSFSFTAPDGGRFYDENEAAHLRDVRAVLWGFLVVAGVSAVVVAWQLSRGWHQRRLWRRVSRGAAALAVATVAVGLFAALAFDVAFEVFHRLLFPAGNWLFDPGSQRLVQLYPLRFWQLTAVVFGILLLGTSTVVWLLARRRLRSL